MSSENNVQNDPLLVIQPSTKFKMFSLGELWRYRELLFFLTWRDVTVRYKQALLGIAWAIIQPVMTMVVFTFLFGNVANLPSSGVPYPIFTYSGLLPWQLFSFSLGASSNSLILNQRLISKVYFPRIIMPIASVLAGLVDFVIAFVILIFLMIYYGIYPGVQFLSIPLYILFALLAALAVGIWLSALNVRYRDVRYAVPFITSLWFYITPVAYSSVVIPDKWKWIYSINPMTGVVEGFRQAIIGESALNSSFFLVSIVISLILLFSGLLYFKNVEDSFADII